MNNIKIENCLFGSDLELFVKSKQSDQIISAEGFILGTKNHPFRFDKTNKYYSTSLDNILAEGNIPPVDSKVEWMRSIDKVKQYIDAHLSQYEMCTVAYPAFKIKNEYLQTDNAKEFGCAASFSAYTMDILPKPCAETNTRSSGFHIHASFDDVTTESVEMFIKTMDLFVGVPSSVYEPKNNRRDLYGKAGEFRFGDKYKGAEYRVPSGWWAGNNERTGFMFDQTLKAIDFINYNDDEVIYELLLKNEGMIVDCINEGSKKYGNKLIKNFNICERNLNFA